METNTRKRWPVEERQSQFIEIALDLFGTRPFDEISMDEIATRAGVTKGLLYRYFESKRELYLSVLREAADEIYEITEPLPNRTPYEQLRDGLDTYLCAIEQHPERFLMFVKSGIGFDEEAWELIEECHLRYLDRIVAGAAPNSTKSEALRLAIRGWLGSVDAIVVRWLLDHRVTRDELRDLLAATLVAALYAAKQIDPTIDLTDLELSSVSGSS